MPTRTAFLLLAAATAACGSRTSPWSVAPQAVVGECGSAFSGSVLILDGEMWVTESAEEMREWLSRIDSADVVARGEISAREGAGLFGTRGSGGGAWVRFRRGSPSQARFTAPPPPVVVRSYCHPDRFQATAAPPPPGP